jgi:dipeptidyl aminopeptidase/acylaminoacyl peptidase
MLFSFCYPGKMNFCISNSLFIPEVIPCRGIQPERRRLCLNVQFPIFMKKKLLFFIFSTLIMSQNTEAQTASPTLLTPEILWQVGRLGLDCVSPDGQWAVYGVQRYDVSKNKGTRTLYIVKISSGESRPLTDPDQTATDAAFRPDGQRIGFLMGGKLHEVKPEGSAIAKVSDEEMNGFQYAPNGKFILYTKDVKKDQTPQEIFPDLPQTSGRMFDGLFYRHWKSWHDYKYSNIFYAPYTDGQLGAEGINIMNERFDSPLRPMGGMEQISWSPDARFIIYTCRKLNGTAEALSTDSDLYAYELASGQTINFTAGLKGYDLDPVFSPDGKYLAWTSMERPGYEADRTRLMVLDLANMSRTELTAGWNYEANHPQWAPDSKSLYFISSTDFTYQLYQIGLNNPKPRRITEGQHDFTSLKVAGNTLVSTRVSMAAPAELYAVDPANGQMRRLTTATASPWDQLEKGKVERHTVKTKDGKNLNVWVIFPPGFDKNKKYPALVYNQGGPQSALSQGFSYRWNFQLMAAQGYVVVAPCRRGMPGSGQEWCDAIMNDWGGKPMQDVLDATDYAAKLPGVDGSRMGAIGASYGGFAVYWLAGNHQKRFKTFISHCGLFNLESFIGTTEEVWFPMNDLGGAYWKAPDAAAWSRFSPHKYVKNWDTPILVIHNELDFRVPFSEGMQAFQAAQLLGIRSKLLTFPDEGHWMSKPQNSILWQRVFFQWLDSTLKQ